MTRLARIVARLGGVLLDGGRRALVPGPGHSKHDRSVSLLAAEDGRILVHCFMCGRPGERKKSLWNYCAAVRC